MSWENWAVAIGLGALLMMFFGLMEIFLPVRGIRWISHSGNSVQFRQDQRPGNITFAMALSSASDCGGTPDRAMPKSRPFDQRTVARRISMGVSGIA